jgi:hypothetical protein
MSLSFMPMLFVFTWTDANARDAMLVRALATARLGALMIDCFLGSGVMSFKQFLG